MMRKIFNPIFILSLAGAFLVSSLVCCCVRHLVQEKTAKVDCCHKTTKADPVKCADGCSSLIKSAETAKIFDLAPNAAVQMPPVIGTSLSFKPVHTIKPVFVNGPPGPVALVPLYTQFHTLRI